MGIIEIFREQNLWWKEGISLKGMVERDIFPLIVNWLETPELIVVTGPRQSGKTTLLFQLIGYLLEKGVHPEKIAYFNLDEEDLRTLFKNTTDFIKFLNDVTQGKARFVLIDEVQKVINCGLLLKKIYDLRKGFKIIVSGSSSLEIRKETGEHLTGRKVSFYLTPFTVTEYIRTKGLNWFHEEVRDFNELERIYRTYGGSLSDLIEEYIIYGGYPRVVLEADKEKKKILLRELYKDYVRKDVRDFFKIEKIEGYNKLVSLLGLNVGNLLNVEEVSNNLSLRREFVEKSIFALESSFVISRLRPYFTNPRKEIVKMSKIYFNDTGLRNSLVDDFSPLAKRIGVGYLMENFICNLLKQKNYFPYFWRTQNKAEVDFVIKSKKGLMPVEVKHSIFKKPKLSKSFHSFMERYGSRRGIVVTKDFLYKVEIGKAEILFVPFFEANLWI